MMSIKSLFKKRAFLFLIVIALLLVFGGWEAGKYLIVPRRFGVVEQDKIFRSGRIAPHLLRATLQKHRLKVIVDLTEPDRPDDQCLIFKLFFVTWHAEQAIAEELGIKRYNFQLYGDGTGNITNYAKAIAVIKQAREENKPVLVHCAAGVQRTGGVIASYRLLVEKQAPATIYAELTRYGWKPGKNKILLEYLNRHMAELNSLLQEMQVIPKEKRPAPRIAP